MAQELRKGVTHSLENCTLTDIARRVTVWLTVVLYFSETVILCCCCQKKRVQVCAPAQTKIEKQQNVLQNKANLCKVQQEKQEQNKQK